MSALPYATYREDMDDCASFLDHFATSLEDSKASLTACKRGLDYATGSSREVDQFMADADALVAKVRAFEKLLRSGRF